ncbi:MAG: rod shape-determining protein MreC [Pseudomonadota bacterium]
MQLDHSMSFTKPLRQGITLVLHPITVALEWPGQLLEQMGVIIEDSFRLESEIRDLRKVEAQNSQALLLLEQLRAENTNLTGLLELRKKIQHPTVAVSVRSAQRDPLAMRVMIDRGQDFGIRMGDPVISSTGIVGQVRRVFPLSAEVQLISDEGLAVPVVIQNLDIRAITQGLGNQDGFELRYVNLAAPVTPGMTIVTSGLDGLFPAGLPVGEIISVTPGREGQFPRVIGKSSARIGTTNQLLVIRSATLNP